MHFNRNNTMQNNSRAMFSAFYSRNRIIVSIILSIVPIFLIHCARESRPTGGDRDTTAPQVLWEKPANKSTHINPKKIIIAFDEAIDLEQVQERCIISPRLDEFPDIRAKKKKLIIQLSKSTLEENTSYSFSFSDAIKDIHEGNSIHNYSYAFSTGDKVDSLTISGNVKYAHSLQIPEKAQVVLHSNLQDSAIQTIAPTYVTTIDKEGNFLFSHIASGTYRLYALEDSNNDFIYNNAKEYVAFYDSLISPTAYIRSDTIWLPRHNDSLQAQKDSFTIEQRIVSSHENIELLLFKNSRSTWEFLSAKRLSKYSCGIQLAGKPNKDSCAFEFIGFPATDVSIEWIHEDSALVWILNKDIYTHTDLQLAVHIGSNTDTVRIPPAKEVPAALQVVHNTARTAILPGDSVYFTASRPIQSIDSLRIALYKSKDTTAYFSSYKQVFKVDTAQLPIVPNQHIAPAAPYIHKHYYENQTLLSHTLGKLRCALYFAKPVSLEDVTIDLEEFPHKENWHFTELDTTSNSILIWITDNDIARLKNISLRVQYNSADSLHTKIIEFDPGFSKKDTYKKSRFPRASLALTHAQTTTLQLDNAIIILSNNPIKTIDTSAMQLTNPTDSIEHNYIQRIEQLGARRIILHHAAQANETYRLHIFKDAVTDVYNQHNREFTTTISAQKKTQESIYTPVHYSSIHSSMVREFSIIAPMQAGTYSMQFPTQSIFDIYGDYIDSCAIAIKVENPETYGTLFVQVDTIDNSMIMQLLKSNAKPTDNAYEAKVTNNKYSFTHIPAGEYELRAYFDSNKNNTWDTGSIETRTQAEKIILHEGTITIKANWENTVEWNITKE